MDDFTQCDDILLNSKHKHQRTIIHVDIDCFYAQVEMLKNPNLVNQPLGIKQKNIVVTSNYVAREYGIEKCMLIKEALALCPKLILVSGEDLHDYRAMSTKVTDLIKQFNYQVEKLGFDENFVDVSEVVARRLCTTSQSTTIEGHVYNNEIEHSCLCGCRERLSLGSNIAKQIRDEIKNKLGVTCCAGISYNKLLAKLVCPTRKPNDQTTVFPCAAASLASSLQYVRAIPGIGRKTTDLLNNIGVYSICDIRNCLVSTLDKHLGKALCHWVKCASYGVDDTEVKTSGLPQSIGIEDAFKMISCISEVEDKFRTLLNRALILLKEDGRLPTTFRITVRKFVIETKETLRETKQGSVNPVWFTNTHSTQNIIGVALNLFKKIVDTSKPFHLTRLGLAFTKFQEQPPTTMSIMSYITKDADNSSVCNNNAVERLNSNILWPTVNDVSCDDDTSDKEVKVMCSESFNNIILPGDIDRSVLFELPAEIRQEVVASHSNSNNVMVNFVPQKTGSCLICPPGINQQTFSELPSDIQQELIHEANNMSHSQVHKKPPPVKKQNSIVNYFTKM